MFGFSFCSLFSSYRASRSFFLYSCGLFAVECLHPFSLGLGSVRSFSEDVAHMPDVKDEEIRCAFKDLMAASWDEIPEAVIDETKKALSKSTDDKAGQEALANVFRAAEAIEEFIGILTNLKMAIDDSIGISGEVTRVLSKSILLCAFSWNYFLIICICGRM